MEDNILEVKKLKISFRTNNGTVKAVRDISFDLKRGETLAIVGESGSGKSVTSKAILGILAGNSIVDGGEILYDGMDLLRIGEEDMYKIRGDKISMIFQDPLSSLDPIVKIGKQITEAMILKNKDSRKNARNEFNEKLQILKLYIIDGTPDDNNKEVEELCKLFDNFNIEAIKIENSYNESVNLAAEIVSSIDDLLFLASRNQKINLHQEINNIISKTKKILDKFILNIYGNLINKSINNLSNHLLNVSKEDNSKLNDEIKTDLENLRDVLIKVENHVKPDFFRIGFYSLTNPEDDIYSMDIEELNNKALDVLNEKFMFRFIFLMEMGLKKANEDTTKGKEEAVTYLTNLRNYFNKETYDKKETLEQIKDVDAIIKKSINELDIIKDSIAYTFPKAIKNAINQLFKNIKNNEKEEIRFDRQTKRRDALIQKGKKIDWKVVPKNIISIKDSVLNITNLIDRLIDDYNAVLANSANVDLNAKAVDLIDHFKELASLVVYKVTKAIAREKAIKLMEEVGIPEPRIRYNQYPFEFSGGMRQRIVIAIALAANPDILICDEPTTALDVTIQSQILELINKLKKERNLSIIFITHDLGVVANMADRIAVMYAGKIVEYGTSEEIFYDPKHPYTWALLSSMPDLDTKEKLEAIPGTPPNMIYPPVGDAFAARNKYAMKIDFEMQPPLFKVTDTHYAATWLLHKDAPHVDLPKVITDRIARMKLKNEEATLDNNVKEETNVETVKEETVLEEANNEVIETKEESLNEVKEDTNDKELVSNEVKEGESNGE